MNKKSSKAKPKRLPGVGSNRMLGCGVLTPTADLTAPDPPAVQAVEECKNASASAFYHLRMGHEIASRAEIDRLLNAARLLQSILKQPNNRI